MWEPGVWLKQAAIRDAAMAEGQFPYTINMHGWSGFRVEFTYLSTHLASHGYLVVSPDTSQVLAEMPHKTYGVARFGDLREEFEVWPTTITGTAIEPRLQSVHFDTVLAKDDMVPPGQRVEDMAKAQRDHIVAALRPTAASLMDLFAPRVGRYSGKDRSRQDHPGIEGREPW